jgi:hypothetical protein
MKVNIPLESRVSEYSFATLSAGVGDFRPTARDAADASRSSLKLSPARCLARDRSECPPRLTEIMPVSFSVCFLGNVPQNRSEHICPKYPHQARLLVLPARATDK